MIHAHTRQCPNCNNTLPVDPGYPTWCDRCEWNLDMPARGQAKNWRQRIYLKISSRLSSRLLRKIIAAGPSAPPFTLPKLLALMLASLVHIFGLTVGITGIRLIVDHTNSFLTLMGILLIVAAYMMRPRFGKLSKYNALSRQYFPTLYKVTDEIAARLGTRKVDVIRITTDFNAYFVKVGWARKCVLGLGIPLLEILTPQEKIALIAHELAHSANGDASRSFIVVNAIRSLNTWRKLLAGGGHLQFMSMAFCFLLLGIPWFIAGFLGFIGILLSLLMASDSQRAEYLADNMAAHAAGTQATVNLLHKFHMEYAIWMAMKNFYDIGITVRGTQGIFEVLRRRVEHVPARELERVARIEKSVASRLDATHPPTAYRIQALQAWPIAQPQVVISANEISAIERELSRIKPDLEDIMLQDYRSWAKY